MDDSFKVRKCMKCGREFQSRGNRLCYKCNNENVYTLASRYPPTTKRRVIKKVMGVV